MKKINNYLLATRHRILKSYEALSAEKSAQGVKKIKKMRFFLKNMEKSGAKWGIFYTFAGNNPNTSYSQIRRCVF